MTRLLIAGDFSPQARLATIHEKSPVDVFGDFLQLVAAADLAILNLEAPLCSPTGRINKTGPCLYGPVESAGFVKQSGFDLVCLANNHIMDFGGDGLAETIGVLRQTGLEWVGAGEDYAKAAIPFVLDIHDQKVAILNFAENEWSTTFGASPGACPIDPVRNHALILHARELAEKVIVISHGGHERHPLPSPGMQELFRFYIDAGADAVVNHHTHCTSGYEIYKKRPIFYSLGNFFFDSEHQRVGPWTQGMAVELLLYGDTVDFKLYHFNQCTDKSLFELADRMEDERRTQRLERLNRVIADPEALAAAFSEAFSERQSMYRAYLEPRLPRLVGAAQRRGWLPSLITKRHRTLLLNLIRCESHREMLLELLKRDAGHSR